MEVADVHLNGGFARAADFTPQEILTQVADPDLFSQNEAEALARLNTDHAQWLRQIIAHFTQSAPRHWRATGLDPEGLDLSCGEDSARLPLRLTVIDNTELMAQLKALSP